jgi:hypothetical protein
MPDMLLMSCGRACRFDQWPDGTTAVGLGQTWSNNGDASRRLTRHSWCLAYRTPNMNSFVSKFSTTDADSEIRRAKDIAEGDGLTDAMWGSQAGYGQLVHGHAFNIPAVPDVRPS